jgi:hypothetical protein
MSDDIKIPTAPAFEIVEQTRKSMNTRISWRNVYVVCSCHADITDTLNLVASQFTRLVPGPCPTWTCVDVANLRKPRMSRA